jgi:hypothetical protein
MTAKQIKKAFRLSRIDKFLIIGLSIEAATGVIGGSLILAEGRPYLTLAVCATGAVASKIVKYVEGKYKEEENED